MSKLIKMTDTSMEVNTTTIEVVEINGVRFEHDEQLVEIEVYSKEGTLVDVIEEELQSPVIDFEDLKREALNWYFNNVEIVKEISKDEGKISL